jgi:hypothetical protein
MRALDQLARHTAMLRRPAPPALPQVAVSVPPGTSRFFNEAESLAFLAAHGLPVVPYRLCRNESEARMAFRELGAPVAVKACSADVPHKSEHGLVALNLVSEEAVAQAVAAQLAKLDAMRAAPDGIVVAAMAEGRRELLLGARSDSVFGPVVMVGDGGKYVEAMPDVAILLPPFGEAEVRDALSRLRIAPILEGVRGEPPLDLHALARAALRLGALIAGSQGRIASIDINPVMLGAEGQGLTIVDALVERANAAG